MTASDIIALQLLNMAAQKPKRDRPVPTTSQRSKKRQKVEISSSYAPAGAGSDVRKVPVALDALPWNEVEMPDMFEDAEGFFGLDEVDNVEVIRDGNQVKFVSICGFSELLYS